MAGNTPGHLLPVLLTRDEKARLRIGDSTAVERLLFDAIANKVLSDPRFDFLSWAEQPQNQVFIVPGGYRRAECVALKECLSAREVQVPARIQRNRSARYLSAT